MAYTSQCGLLSTFSRLYLEVIHCKYCYYNLHDELLDAFIQIEPPDHGDVSKPTDITGSMITVSILSI